MASRRRSDGRRRPATVAFDTDMGEAGGFRVLIDGNSPEAQAFRVFVGCTRALSTQDKNCRRRGNPPDKVFATFLPHTSSGHGEMDDV